MAKLTREQYNKWNAQAKNGFYFDIEYYLIHNEKTLTKDVEQKDGTIIRFRLWYIEEYEQKINSYGCKWNERTGKQIPVMQIDRLVPCGNNSKMYRVISLIYNKPMGDPEKTMKYATLCRISGEVNIDEELKAIA